MDQSIFLEISMYSDGIPEAIASFLRFLNKIDDLLILLMHTKVILIDEYTI